MGGRAGLAAPSRNPQKYHYEAGTGLTFQWITGRLRFSGMKGPTVANYCALWSVVFMIGYTVLFDRMVWRNRRNRDERHARLLKALCNQLAA